MTDWDIEYVHHSFGALRRPGTQVVDTRLHASDRQIRALCEVAG